MGNSFHSKRLIYRAVDGREDEAFLLSLLLDPHAYLNSNPTILKPVSRTDTAAYITTFTERMLMGVLICLPDSYENGDRLRPTPVGSIFLTKAKPGTEHHRNSKMGLSIVAEHRDKGYGAEAIKWILDWGFKIAGLHRISVNCFEWKARAIGTYQRLGFLVEGRRREALWYDGGWKDLLELGILEEEWRKRYTKSSDK